MSDENWYTEATHVLSNLAQSLLSVEQMLTGASYLMGIGFFMKALLTLKTHGEQRSSSGASSMKEAIIYMFVAIMLLYFPTAFEVVMNTTFGYSNVLSYSTVSTTSPIMNSILSMDSEAGQSIVIIIQTIGLCAFIRGWVLISRISQGQSQGNLGKGLMHVVGGTFAMNVVGTIEVFWNTLFGT